MLKLSPRDEKRRDEIIDDLETKQGECDGAWANVEEAIRAYNETINAFNQTLSEAEGWREDIEREQAEYADARSDKWRDGDKGEAYAAWHGEFENADFSEVEDFVVDAPGSDIADRITALRDLPSEPDEA